MEIQLPKADGQRDPLEFIFSNQRGLRPGWRLGIFVVLVYVLFREGIPLLLSPLARFSGPGFYPSFFILSEVLSLLVVIFASWVMARIEHRDMGEYGLPIRRSGALSRFVRGYTFWGFLPLSLLLLVMRGLHAFYFGDLALHGRQILYWGGVWGVVFIFVGLSEEYMVRGYALYTLAEGIGFWPAAVVLAAVFAWLHRSNSGEARIGIIMTAVFAIYASVTLRYTGNLWMAVGLHAGWDWGQSYFYGTPNSGLVVPGHLLNPHTQGPTWLTGGSVGPEGSILVLVLLVLVTALFVLLHRKSKRPVLVVTTG